MRPFELFLYVAVVFGWSTSWYPLSLQLGVVAPEVSIFWRFLVSSLMMLAITAFCGIRLRFGRGASSFLFRAVLDNFRALSTPACILRQVCWRSSCRCRR